MKRSEILAKIEVILDNIDNIFYFDLTESILEEVEKYMIPNNRKVLMHTNELYDVSKHYGMECMIVNEWEKE